MYRNKGKDCFCCVGQGIKEIWAQMLKCPSVSMQHTVIFELETCEIISLMCQLGAQVVIYYNRL